MIPELITIQRNCKFVIKGSRYLVDYDQMKSNGKKYRLIIHLDNVDTTWLHLQ